MLVGEGRYGCRRQPDGESVLPISLFGVVWPIAGCEDDVALEKALTSNRGPIATALESFAVVGVSDRAALIASGGDFRRWNDARRTSMNDICGRAYAMAKVLREQLQREAHP